MLRNSFVQFSGVGGKTESKLWQDGILTWDAYLAQEKPPLGKKSHEKVVDEIGKSKAALENGNLEHFQKDYFDKEDSWRSYGEFKSRFVYLDVFCSQGAAAQAKVLLGVDWWLAYTPFVVATNKGY